MTNQTFNIVIQKRPDDYDSASATHNRLASGNETARFVRV